MFPGQRAAGQHAADGLGHEVNVILDADFAGEGFERPQEPDRAQALLGVIQVQSDQSEHGHAQFGTEYLFSLIADQLGVALLSLRL